MSILEIERATADLSDDEARRLYAMLGQRLKPVSHQPSPPLAEGETLYNRIKHLAGCIEDGPEDLSTNKKYMEGFGED